MSIHDSIESRTLTMTIPPNKSRERIDTFLAREMARYSRSQIQTLIKAEKVRVDGRTVRSNYIVRPLECVTIEVPKPREHDLEPENIPLDIVFEDDYLIVLNKPAGMVVHPAHGHSSGTLVNALLYHCSRLSSMHDTTRPGIVHRLDKDTSGLLLAVKDDEVHRGLARQFSDKTVNREYKAIVWRHFKNRSGTIETMLARSTRDRKIFTVAADGKHAVTHYQVLEQFDFLSFVSLKLETGRTHQIRVHLSHMGHPVFGDQTYGGRGRQLGGLNHERTAFTNMLLEALPRQALHAQTLGFLHPVTGEHLFFTSELPDDMQFVLDALRKKKAEWQGDKA
ncbi:RluA family pseudouridine synthase [bacterium]|nr:RluA family pseudouridine synthase [bacterium]